ncbi:uncharacterized protein LOC124283606 [Haliotis rubra]|uniref:uncharacterized protein LOC124283606 n=1 Tax=Haliotis rubra TaxID=36100 RepID=UPI001EE60B5D|nr:uncharacterized protein LOC124283606 [Haliotis rubra]
MSLRKTLHVKWCTNMWIILCCSLVDATTNVAVGKPTYFSTNFPISYSQPSHVVDGNTDSDMFRGSCFATNVDDLSPWWMVDLLSTYTIGNITIYNRGDCCSERLHDVTVEVFSVNPARCPNATAAVCKELPGQLAMVSNITCDQEVVGRFVRIRKGSSTREDVLNICEIEITGVPHLPGCGKRAIPVTNGRRLQPLTGPEVVSVDSRLDCGRACIFHAACFGWNFQSQDFTCELINSTASDGTFMDDPLWTYSAFDICVSG